MAKEATAKTEKKKPTPPTFEKPEYGIDALAKEMGVTDTAGLRVRLRGAEGLKDQFKKGRSWDFGNKKNLESVAKQLAKPAKEAKAKDEKKDDKKAAKK